MHNLAVFLLGVAVAGQPTAREADFDPSRGKRFTVAVVEDGSMPGDDIDERVAAELATLVGTDTRFQFETGPEYDAGWDPARARLVIENALKDRSIDFIVAQGLIVSQAAAGIELTKPVLCTFAQRIDLFGIHDADTDRSTKKNLSFILVPLSVEGDFDTFEWIIKRDASVLVDEAYVTHVTGLSAEVAAIAEKVGIEFELVGVGADPDRALDRLSDDKDVVVLGPLPRFGPAELDRLIDGLTRRGKAVLSVMGEADVHAGALAARLPDIATARARRIALNLNELARGTSPNDLAVVLPADPQLFLNARAARTIGYKPHFDVLISAEIIHPEALEQDAEPLGLSEAMRRAEAGNVDLRISTQQIETALRERNVARSALFPQLLAVPSYQALDTGGLEGFIPDQTGTIGLRLSQMIYDDARVADFNSSSRLYEGSQEAREVSRLDVLDSAGAAYLNLALARILYRIELENLALTEENLDLARVRLDVGHSGRDEVHRWEAEVARRRRDLFAAESDIEVQRIILNQLLGTEQDRRWLTDVASVDTASFPFVDGRFADLFRDASGLATWRQLMVEFAIESSPELRFVGKNLEANGIQLDQRKRRWYLPAFSFDFVYDHDFYQSPGDVDFPNDLWSLQLVGVYPVFEGGRRAEEIERVASEQATLEQEWERASQLVERRTRTALRAMEASFPSIRFAQTAAEKARLNLEVVQDKYAQGLVNVTDLLEAQNESFRAEQTAAGAIYEFELDLIRFQRAIAWFQYEKTADERDEFVAWVETRMQAGEE